MLLIQPKSLNRVNLYCWSFNNSRFCNSLLLTFGGFKQFIPAVIGLVVGLAIGTITEIFTSDSYKYVKEIAHESETGSATTIIAGLGVGMRSTVYPIILIAIAVILAFAVDGLYGIAIAAVGMLGNRR